MDEERSSTRRIPPNDSSSVGLRKCHVTWSSPTGAGLRTSVPKNSSAVVHVQIGFTDWLLVGTSFSWCSSCGTCWDLPLLLAVFNPPGLQGGRRPGYPPLRFFGKARPVLHEMRHFARRGCPYVHLVRDACDTDIALARRPVVRRGRWRFPPQPNPSGADMRTFRTAQRESSLRSRRRGAAPRRSHREQFRLSAAHPSRLLPRRRMA